MSEQLKEWSNMWGAKVKLRNDMPDDMLRDAIETSRRVLDSVSDFETQGTRDYMTRHVLFLCHSGLYCVILQCHHNGGTCPRLRTSLVFKHDMFDVASEVTYQTIMI